MTMQRAVLRCFALRFLRDVLPRSICTSTSCILFKKGTPMQPLSIGLIGDYSPAVPAHVAIPQALDLAAGVLGCSVRAEWLPTEQLTGDVAERLGGVRGALGRSG